MLSGQLRESWISVSVDVILPESAETDERVLQADRFSVDEVKRLVDVLLHSALARCVELVYDVFLVEVIDDVEAELVQFQVSYLLFETLVELELVNAITQLVSLSEALRKLRLQALHHVASIKAILKFLLNLIQKRMNEH